MSCNCNNNCLEPNNCNCNCTTSSTTCRYVAEQPCIVICDDIFDTACIIYDGEDNDCYGIKKGDTVKDIINRIINILVPSDCNCQYGAATINYITTTTTIS